MTTSTWVAAPARLWRSAAEDLSARWEESYTRGRVAQRLGRGTPEPRAAVPERPVGAKLELTHACNLRCDFCYTDSPRHTLQRTPDVSDDMWRSVVEQTIELGVIEAVVTGGEPLLRAPLALELVERLAGAGVGVTLNTNGWFVDEAIADRLARVPGLQVNISIDGASPELHDAARGVPGSWRRAVRAIGLLLARDVKVVVVHVVTPLNARWVPNLLEHLWLLGVGPSRLTPVLPVGAASRTDGWTVDRRALRHAAAEARKAFGEGFEPLVQSGTAASIVTRERRAPATYLVRPSGAVLIDSLHPFAFGHVDDGLARCWEQIVAEWRHPDITAWADGLHNSRGLAKASVVPYADVEPKVGAPQRGAAPARDLRPRLPKRSAQSTEAAADPGDMAAARAHVLAIARARRYELAPMRWGGDRDGERVLRLTDSGSVCRVNRSAAALLDCLGDRTLGDAVDGLSARHPAVDRARLESDALRTVRWLRARGVVRARPAAA